MFFIIGGGDDGLCLGVVCASLRGWSDMIMKCDNCGVILEGEYVLWGNPRDPEYRFCNECDYKLAGDRDYNLNIEIEDIE